MMYNSSYSTSSYQDRYKKTLLWIIGINVGIWVIQLATASMDRNLINEIFALKRYSLGRGYLWTPITYAFLHDTQNFFHIIGNMLMVFFLGRTLLPVLGQGRFFQLYLGSALVGGVLWYLASFASLSPGVIGASGAALGLLAFFACLYPDREIQMLIFFVLPVRVKPKVLAWIVLGISSIGFLFSELVSGGDSVAHSAHLGGMLAGYLFHKFVYAKAPYQTESKIKIKMPSFLKRSSSSKSSGTYNYSVNISKPRDMKAEVDRILDKINSKGFGSLTSAEKKTLDEARDLLRKR